MYPRTEYEMTEDDLQAILTASRPTPVMFLSGGTPMSSSTQENANRVWAELGKRMGFDYMTVRPIPGKGTRFFTAVPSETEDQRTERLKQEAAAKRIAEIAQLEGEIAERQRRLETLQSEVQ
jgi:hypothetical protein